LKAVSWAFHDGVAYIFPKPTDVSLNNRAYTGSWQSIVNSTRTWSADEETKELFSLWIDHGLKPEDAGYEYIVAPGTDLSVFDPEKISSSLKILANTPTLQAVQHQELNITQMVFYEPGKILIADGLSLSTQNPGLVLIKTSGLNIEQITIADPARNLHSFQLSVTAKFSGAGTGWKAEWNKKEKTSTVFINLPAGAEAGKSITIRNNTFEPESGKEKSATVISKPTGKEKVIITGKHYIGERYGGGMVIWLDETGDHGLIAALSDQSNGIQWRNGASKKSRHFGDHGDRVVNARGDGIGAGEMNTTLIIAQLTDDDISGNFAAMICANWQTEDYGDWYLPSKAELNTMYQLRNEIGGFENDMYWSSTEFNVGFCWGQNFKGYGGQYTQNKSSAYAVRCVRKF
jgi:chondroitin AC lyase